MKKTFASGALFALSCSMPAFADNNKAEYLSDWWHQSINVVGSAHTRFGPQLSSTTYLEYEAFARKDWFDFYGYADAPKFFGGDPGSRGIWDKGSPLFVEIEPRFSIDKLTGTDLSVGPFKEWYIANNVIYDQGRNRSSRQSTWYMGLGTDIDTGTDLSLSVNGYAKYQWQNYGAANENEWDGYRVKVKYAYPLGSMLGGDVSYISFTNFDFGSKLRDKSNASRTNNAIASSHILALGYDHWHYSFVARYFHNGGQWADGTELDFGKGPFEVKSTGWGYYLVVGYNF